VSLATLAVGASADAVKPAFLRVVGEGDDVAGFLSASEEAFNRFLEGFEALTGSAQSVAGAGLAATAFVLIMGGSPDRSSDNRCPHEEKPRCTGCVGDGAAQRQRSSDTTNACGAGQVEGKVVRQWQLRAHMRYRELPHPP
jgi:hypothetical protein